MRISKLSAKCKRLESFGIVRAPEYDFEDDGNFFKGWCWKGKLPISQLYSDGSLYLTIREDYVRQVPYEFWSNNYKTAKELSDKWNGVEPGFELEEFANACEVIWNAIQDAQKAFSKVELDNSAVIEKLKAEIIYSENALKRNLNWFEMNLNESGIKQAYRYYTSLKETVAADNNTLEKLLSNKMEKSRLYDMVGSVNVATSNIGRSKYYANELNDLIDQKDYHWYYLNRSASMK